MKYIKLIVALISIYITLTLVIPWINSWPFFTPMQDNIERWGINTSAFFYTDDISENESIREHTDL